MARPIHSRSIWLLPLISRPHPGPAAAAGGLARRGCSPRALCYPDPRARLLQARRGSWPGGGPAAARRTDGPAAVRRPVAAYSLPLGGRGGGGAADSAADCPPNRRASRRPVRPEAAPIPPKPPLLSARSRTTPIELCVRPAAALVVTCAQAQLIMLPAVLHLPLFKHHTSTTFLHSPHDALPLSPYASLRHPLAAFRSRNDAFCDIQDPSSCSIRGLSAIIIIRPCAAI